MGGTKNQLEQVDGALENSRLFRATSHQLEVMRTLYDISVDISSQLELQQVLATVVRQAAYLMGAEGSCIAVRESETNLVRVVALHNVSLIYDQQVIRPGASGAAHVLLTGEPVITDKHYWKPEDLADPTSNARVHPYEGTLNVPLLWADQVMGVISVVHRGERPQFNQEDVRFLSLLANLASAAINKAKWASQIIEFNQRLESMVNERTNQLAKAQDELAQKAVQLQRLLEVTINMQEEERLRIALDLHDGSNQLITGTLFEIQAAQQSIQRERQDVALSKLEMAKKYLRELECENRRIISGLRPPLLDTSGLVNALQRQVETFQECFGANCTLEVSGKVVRLDSNVEINIYRIVQESLNNIRAHAQAKSIKVRLKFDPSFLRIEVIDDGMGFVIDNVAASDRMGMIGMRERAISIGGKLEVRSETGNGTKVILELPLPAPSLSKIQAIDTLVAISTGCIS